jgi:pre-mRNA-splicing factor ISY1
MQREDRLEKSWEKPSDPGTVQSLSICERWRKRICEELDQKLERLYNEPLPEAETRFLNDEVNSIIREIRRWEIRILELGGIDYSKVSHQAPTGDHLNMAVGHYQYFGRARNLPGVRELLEMEKQQQRSEAGKKVNKQMMMERVDLVYFGLQEEMELELEEKRMEEEMGVLQSEPMTEKIEVPTDEEIREAVERLLRGGDSKVAEIVYRR